MGPAAFYVFWYSSLIGRAGRLWSAISGAKNSLSSLGTVEEVASKLLMLFVEFFFIKMFLKRIKGAIFFIIKYSI